MFDLTVLTEFNEALVYGFSPETVPNDNNFERVFSQEFCQYRDVFNAYFYAQTVILPQIKKDSWHNISSEQLLEWVKKLHYYIGNSLLDFSGHASGEYTQNIIFRYHQGAELHEEFVLYLSGLHEYKNKYEFAGLLNKKYKLSTKNSLPFIKILEKIKDDPQYLVDPHEASLIDKSQPASVGFITLIKLGTAYITDKFSEKERADIEKVMLICNPYTVNHRMATWADWTLKSLRELDVQDFIKMSSFLANMFYQLTEIHPFVNANGRTATSFLNIILRSFNLPSIVLRHPHEKGDSKSLYTLAFNQINESTLYNLQKLILLRINEAQTAPFKDDYLKKFVILRVTFNELISEFKRNHTNFDISNFISAFRKTHSEQLNQIQARHNPNKNQGSYETILLLLPFFDTYLKAQKPNLINPFTFYSRSVTNTALHNQLETITQISNWKLNPKELDTYWVKFPSKAAALITKSLLENLVIAADIKCEQIKNSTEVVLICKHMVPSRLAFYAEKFTAIQATNENQLVLLN